MNFTERVKELTLEEIKKINLDNIAYMTLVGGKVLVVKGLDYKKFDEKEKVYEKKNKDSNGFKPSNLRNIQEASEKNERNSNQVNQELVNDIIDYDNNLNKFPDENPNDIDLNINNVPYQNNNLRYNNNYTTPQIYDNQNYSNINKSSFQNIYYLDNNEKFTWNDNNKFYHSQTNNNNNLFEIRQCKKHKINKKYDSNELLKKNNNKNNIFLLNRPFNYYIENNSERENYSNFSTYLDSNNDFVILTARPRRIISDNSNYSNNLFRYHYSIRHKYKKKGRKENE